MLYKIKQFRAFGLVVCLLLSLFADCGSSADKAGSAVGGGIPITVEIHSVADGSGAIHIKKQ